MHGCGLVVILTTGWLTKIFPSRDAQVVNYCTHHLCNLLAHNTFTWQCHIKTLPDIKECNKIWYEGEVTEDLIYHCGPWVKLKNSN